MKNLKTYTISIYSETNVGLLNRISSIFLKRHFNIESLTTSQSEIKDVFRFVIIVKIDEERKSKVITKDDIQKTVSKIANVPENTINSDEKVKLKNLERDLICSLIISI